MPVHSLSVLLLKDTVTSRRDALKSPDSLDHFDLGDEEGAGSLYWRATKQVPPRWVRLFSPATGDRLGTVSTGSAAAVLVIQVGGRWFALTFGFGRSLLKPDVFEENFGLKVVLNAVNAEKLRSIDSQSLETVALSRRNQSGRAADLDAFGIDIDRDLLFAASGEPTDPTFGKQIAGKDSLRLSIELTLADVPPLLGRLLALYGSTAYQTRGFSWIDNLAEVRDPTLRERLDLALEAVLAAEEPSRQTWLAPPDIIDWADVECFKYQKRSRGTPYEDISWQTYIEEMGGAPTVQDLKSTRIHCISASSGNDLHVWPAYRCVYCELNIDGKTFVLTNGRWYRVDQDFLTELNADIAAVSKSTLALPNYTTSDKDEEAYNLRVSAGEPDVYAFMDSQNVMYGGGQSRIEFCDLFSRDRCMIHVKRYAGSSVLSHLFSQAVVPAELLLRSPDFREKLNAKLPADYRLPDPINRPNPADFEVVYGIVTNSKSDAIQLPLFSRITLRNATNRLAALAVRVSLAFIRMDMETDDGEDAE